LVCDGEEGLLVDPAQCDGQACRVLVVDDDAEFAAVLAAALCLEPGMQVHVAVGVDDGACAACGADVVLVDVRMPGGGGPELARRVSGLARRVAVVAMSGTADPAARAAMSAAGAVGFLDKTDPIEAVCAGIWSACRARSAPLAEQP
jgi:DNA-binding NarL/FixJ family response regulator